MNALIGDSRVRSLKFEHLNSLSENWVLPGAKIMGMEELIQDCVIMHHGEDYQGKMHVYISAGICDLTTKLKSKNYEEIIFESDKIDEIILKTMSSFKSIHQLSLREDVTPVFTTIYPMSLKAWNLNRLDQKKTSYLVHQTEYDVMQLHLEETLEELNKFIIQLNVTTGVTTPLVHKHLVHHRGKGNTTYKYNLLCDGCHPNTHLKSKIAHSIAQAIKKNRSAN